MAEPLSFIASMIAVATLAESVVGKGYRYMKAVRSCPGEVRSLVAEVNVLCGVLDRLSRLLKSEESDHEVETDAVAPGGSNTVEGATFQSNDPNYTDSSEQSQTGRTVVLVPPEFIHECQRVLSNIETIIDEFSGMNAKGAESSDTSKVRRLTSKDFKWPLQKSKTLQLMDQLERLKTTCTLALAESSIDSMYSVLEQTKLSNRCLADLKEKQEKVLDLIMTDEQKKVLAGLSASDPTMKLKAIRRDRQHGTGTWLFDLDEVGKWVDGSSPTLWIYGIPGAGKTILSTLVVDEVLNRKRSSSVGTAYFYIRHDDTSSHSLTNILGSLIAQLARQSSSALDDIMDLRAQHPHGGKLSAALNEDEMADQLQTICRHFNHVFIMIDGLDECGTAFDNNRKRLLEAVAELHQVGDDLMRMLIFSRDEFDIRSKFDMAGFEMVSVAATSADLRLYVNAWLPSLDIRNVGLRAEAVETLISESNGMFMWVRAQVDYSQRLPNDTEKRRALRELPPSLPDTYIRIFEAIDNTYPVQTTKYIQRLLKWLVLAQYGSSMDVYRHSGNTPEPRLTNDMLCQAICLENEHDVPLQTAMITRKQMLSWLGCLVKSDQAHAAMTLSHFTVKEFLTMNPDLVPSSVARKYLVDEGDTKYLLDTCLTCIMHGNIVQQSRSSAEAVEALLSEQTLLQYSTIHLLPLLWRIIYSGFTEDYGRLLRVFLSLPLHPSFELWDTCSVYLMVSGLDIGPISLPTKRDFPSPLHFAAVMGSAEEVRRTLSSGADAEDLSLHMRHRSPLHLAIYTGNRYGVSNSLEADYIFYDNEHAICDSNDNDQNHNNDNKWTRVRQERSLQVIKTLVESGADVNRQLIVYKFCDIDEGFMVLVTPLTLAVYCHFWQAADFLLEMNAIWDAIEAYDEPLDDVTIRCSMEILLAEKPRLRDLLDCVTESDRYPHLGKAFEEWRERNINQSLKQQMNLGGDEDFSQVKFVNAYQRGDWPAVRELLTIQTSIEVNCNDDSGQNALHYCAAEEESESLAALLRAGASPNLLTLHSWSALLTAVRYGLLDNAALLLSHGAELEYPGHGGYTALLEAVYCGHDQMAEFLLQKGAKANAVVDDGRGALHIAIEQSNSVMFHLLLSKRVNPCSPDNYGSTPLHEACRQGLEHEVETLLELLKESVECIDYDSCVSGTPLYIAARKGLYSIVTSLLVAGADINRVGLGNALGSPLMGACAEGHGSVVELLLSRGASQVVEGSRFVSAVETARAFRQWKILAMLEEYRGRTEPDMFQSA